MTATKTTELSTCLAILEGLFDLPFEDVIFVVLLLFGESSSARPRLPENKLLATITLR